MLQRVPDSSDYLQAMTHGIDRDPEPLAIHELEKAATPPPRTWNLIVQQPLPDEEALDRAEKKGFEKFRKLILDYYDADKPPLVELVTMIKTAEYE